MFSTTLPLLLTIVLTTRPDMTPNPTTYRLYYVTPVPPPATLLVEITCMKACEKEVQQCMANKVSLTEGGQLRSTVGFGLCPGCGYCHFENNI